LAGLVHKMGYDIGPKRWIKKADENNRYGYFECLPLLSISNTILAKLGGDFHDIPDFPEGWTRDFDKEKKAILRIVQRGQIELYKGNRLLVLSQLYDELFPEAKWLFIHRDVEATFRSRFGGRMSFEKWKKITKSRMDIWFSSSPSRKALYIDYDDFKMSAGKPVSKIAEYLGLQFDDERLENLIELFRPQS